MRFAQKQSPSSAAPEGTRRRSQTPSVLMTPKGLLCHPKYRIWRLPGAIEHVWLQEAVVEKLRRVDHLIDARTGGLGRLLIWDGLRTMRTQQHLYETERKRIDLQHASKTPAERKAILEDIVRPPTWDRPPPHATGGAVDCTIWIDGSDNTLGEFDDFTERGRPDHFAVHPATSPEDLRTAEMRTLLRNAMLSEGFVGIDSEWWHYEFGTRTWAEANRTSPIFDTVLEAPIPGAPANGIAHMPSRYPDYTAGVAQLFASPDDRAQALRGENDAHYYARTRHPTERRLAARLASMVGTEDAVLFPSGLSATLTAVWAHTPRGGRVLLDHGTYYETCTALKGLAPLHGWTIEMADLSDADQIAQRQLQRFDTVLVDHPRNWMLTCPDLAPLRQQTRSACSTLIVDTSVQPLQNLTFLGLADLLVISLSKYPSSGETAGGAVLGATKFLKPVDDVRKALGLLLAPEAAGTVQVGLSSLKDRMTAISGKACRIVAALHEMPFVRDVRFPRLEHVGALPGGQITFLVDPRIACNFERLVAANTLDEEFPLAFACTFGASFTTVEHFDSRNTDLERTSAGSGHIEPGRIRLGVGNEDESAIIEALQFALRAAAAVEQS
jgi:D-alanyl-D-alanine dipeptidase